MPHLTLPRALRRSHTLALLAAGAAVAVLVVIATRGGATTPTAAQVAATSHQASPSAGGGAAGLDDGSAAAAPATPTPVPSGMRVLQAQYSFRDESAQHAGAPQLTAANGVLIDLDAHRILWGRNPHEPRPPASTTKIFSSMVALENFDLSRQVDVTPDALFGAADETKLGIQAGDHYTVLELLQAMLTISANDAADAIAVDTVGLPRFVAAMNEQVAALGLRDSHFTSPVGLDDPGQRASAYDLAVGGAALYDNFPAARDIVGRIDINVPATGGHIAYTLHNLNRLLKIYPPALGIKPGWTGDAGYCVVAMAERSGHRLVAVLMDDPHMYDQTRALLEWGFGQLGIAPLPTPTPVPTPTPHR